MFILGTKFGKTIKKRVVVICWIRCHYIKSKKSGPTRRDILEKLIQDGIGALLCNGLGMTTRCTKTAATYNCPSGMASTFKERFFGYLSLIV